jgi:hypothetical protein
MILMVVTYILLSYTATGALITAVFFGFNVSLKPYATSSLNRTQAATLVSLYLNLFLGILLCLSKYMDLDRQQSCADNLDDECAKWKSTERNLAGAIFTIISISVLLVPILNWFLSQQNVWKVCRQLLQHCKRFEIQKRDSNDGKPCTRFKDKWNDNPDASASADLGYPEQGTDQRSGT